MTNSSQWFSVEKIHIDLGFGSILSILIIYNFITELSMWVKPQKKRGNLWGSGLIWRLHPWKKIVMLYIVTFFLSGDKSHKTCLSQDWSSLAHPLILRFLCVWGLSGLLQNICATYAINPTSVRNILCHKSFHFLSILYDADSNFRLCSGGKSAIFPEHPLHFIKRAPRLTWLSQWIPAKFKTKKLELADYLK